MTSVSPPGAPGSNRARSGKSSRLPPPLTSSPSPGACPLRNCSRWRTSAGRRKQRFTRTAPPRCSMARPRVICRCANGCARILRRRSNFRRRPIASSSPRDPSKGWTWWRRYCSIRATGCWWKLPATSGRCRLLDPTRQSWSEYPRTKTACGRKNSGASWKAPHPSRSSSISSPIFTIRRGPACRPRAGRRSWTWPRRTACPWSKTIPMSKCGTAARHCPPSERCRAHLTGSTSERRARSFARACALPGWSFQTGVAWASSPCSL